MPSWVFDKDSVDSKGRPQWMIYDEEEPDTKPVLARAVRSEGLARLFATVPKMHTHYWRSDALGMQRMARSRWPLRS